MTTVAAIVPVYNNGTYLSKCLDSIFSQTRPFDEVVIVDDHSTDPLAIDILRSLEARRGVKLWRNESNVGISASQNKAVEMCESHYVAFVDCDDFLSEKANARVCEAISEATDYVFTDRMDVDEKGAALRRYDAGALISGHRHGLPDLLLDQMVASHLKVVRRLTLKKIGGFRSEFDGVQDWDAALRVSEFGEMVHVPEALYFHRIHTEQATSTFRAVNFRRMNEVRRMALERRGLATRKPPSAGVASRAEHAGRLIAAALAEGRDPRNATPSGGLVLALDGGPVKAFSLFERKAADGVKDGAVCLVLSDFSDRVAALRRLGLCERATVGLVVFPNRKSIIEAQKYNSYFDFLVHTDRTTMTGLAGYCWSGLTEFALR